MEVSEYFLKFQFSLQWSEKSIIFRKKCAVGSVVATSIHSAKKNLKFFITFIYRLMIFNYQKVKKLYAKSFLDFRLCLIMPIVFCNHKIYFIEYNRALSDKSDFSHYLRYVIFNLCLPLISF